MVGAAEAAGADGPLELPPTAVNGFSIALIGRGTSPSPLVALWQSPRDSAVVSSAPLFSPLCLPLEREKWVGPAVAQLETFRRFSAGVPATPLGTCAPEGARAPKLLTFTAVVLGLQKYDSSRFRSEERSMNSKKWPSIFSTEADEPALTVGTIFLRGVPRVTNGEVAVVSQAGMTPSARRDSNVAKVKKQQSSGYFSSYSWCTCTQRQKRPTCHLTTNTYLGLTARTKSLSWLKELCSEYGSE